jgi:probable HAF family extracellular repeat protein
MKEAFCALSMLVLITNASADDVRYKVTDLGTLGSGTRSYGLGISNSGQVVGYSTGSPYLAFIHNDGTTSSLGTLPGGSDSRANAVNDDGLAVGSAFLGGTNHAVRFSGGAVQDLGTVVDGTYSEAYGINSLGHIVGATVVSGKYHAILWSGGSAQDLGGLTGPTMTGSSFAKAINDDGQIAGYTQDNAGLGHAFLMANGTAVDLGLTNSEAYAINNNGDIVGKFGFSAARAFLYKADGTTVTLSNSTSIASDINDSGSIVGSTKGFTGSYRAFLYSDGTLQNLNDMIDSSSGWTLTDANAISDTGWITGTGTNALGQTHAFLLTPVPEPATWVALIGVGALGLGWRRYRKAKATTQDADGEQEPYFES